MTTDEIRTVPVDAEALDDLLKAVRGVIRKQASDRQSERRDALMAAVVFHEHDRLLNHGTVLDSAEVFLGWLRVEGSE